MNSSWNERVGIQTQVLAMNRNSPTDRKWIIDEKKWNFDFLAWINVCNHKGTHCRFHWSKWWTAVANFHKINHQMQLQVTSSAAAFLIEKKDSRRLAISSPMYETSSNSFGSPVDFQVSCITGAFAFIYGRGVSNVRGRPAALGALSNPQFSKRLAIKSQPIYLSLSIYIYIYMCVFIYISTCCYRCNAVRNQSDFLRFVWIVGCFECNYSPFWFNLYLIAFYESSCFCCNITPIVMSWLHWNMIINR